MLCACLVSVCPAEYSPISLPTASPRCSPVPQATARARGAVAPGTGDAGRPRCPGQAVSGARRGTPRGAGGARRHHGQVHRAGHDGVVDRWQALQRRPLWGARGARPCPPPGIACRTSQQMAWTTWSGSHRHVPRTAVARLEQRNALTTRGGDAYACTRRGLDPGPRLRLGALRQRRDV